MDGKKVVDYKQLYTKYGVSLGPVGEGDTSDGVIAVCPLPLD